MTKLELSNLIGKTVNVAFKDGSEATGVLGYTTEFSSKFNWRKPDYFTVGDYDFKVSHISKVTIL